MRTIAASVQLENKITGREPPGGCHQNELSRNSDSDSDSDSAVLTWGGGGLPALVIWRALLDVT
jgi:hypothetical protein